MNENLKDNPGSCLNKTANLFRFKNPNDYNVDALKVIETLKKHIGSNKDYITTEFFEKYNIILKTCKNKDSFHIEQLLKKDILKKHILNKDNLKTTSWLKLLEKSHLEQLKNYKNDFLKSIEPLIEVNPSFRNKISKQCFDIVEHIYENNSNIINLKKQLDELTFSDQEPLHHNTLYLKALYAIFSDTNASKSINVSKSIYEFMDDFFTHSLTHKDGLTLWKKFVSKRNDISKKIQLPRDKDFSYLEKISKHYGVPGQIPKEIRKQLPAFLDEAIILYDNSGNNYSKTRSKNFKHFKKFCNERLVSNQDDDFLDVAFQILYSKSDDHLKKFILNQIITLFDDSANVINSSNNNSKIWDVFKIAKSLLSFNEKDKKCIIEHVRNLDIKGKEKEYIEQLIIVLDYKKNEFLEELISIIHTYSQYQDDLLTYFFDILYLWDNKNIRIRLVLTMCNAISYYSIREMSSTENWQDNIFQSFYKLLEYFEKEEEIKSLKKEFRQKLIQDIFLLYGNKMTKIVYERTVDLCKHFFSGLEEELTFMKDLISFVTNDNDYSSKWINTYITMCYMYDITQEFYRMPLIDFIYGLTLQIFRNKTSLDEEKKTVLIDSFKKFCTDDKINKLINEIEDNDIDLEQIKLISQLFSDRKNVALQKYLKFCEYTIVEKSMERTYIHLSLQLLKSSIYESQETFESIKDAILNLYHNDILKTIKCDKRIADSNLRIIHEVLNIPFLLPTR